MMMMMREVAGLYDARQDRLFDAPSEAPRRMNERRMIAEDTKSSKKSVARNVNLLFF